MPYAKPDKLTDADRKSLAGLQDQEARRETTVLLHTDDGPLVRQHERREVYTWTDSDLGEIVFDVRGIKDGILSGELDHVVLCVDLDQDWIDYIRANNGVEEARLATVKNLDRPGIAVMFPNDAMSLIDGNHRAVKRWENGETTLRIVVVGLESLARYSCRPGDESKLFTRERDPGAILLRSEVHKL